MCLAATFLVHLCLRAYWVGLIGLDSVIPGGPSLDEHLKQGPHYKAHLAKYRITDTKAAIERTDNRATLLFAFGVGMAAMMIIPALLVCATGAAALLLKSFMGSKLALITALAVIAIPILLASTAPSLIDKYYGERFAVNSRAARFLEKSYGMLRSIGMDGSSNLPALYMYGWARNFRSALLLFAGLGMVMGTIAMSNAPRFIPISTQEKVVAALEDADYADTRGDDLRFAQRAYIQSAEITENWLDVRVPIPFKQPKNTLIECQKNTAERIRACLQTHIKLFLDGNPMPVSWKQQSATEMQLPTLRAIIDLQQIGEGPHTLTIDYLPNIKTPNKAAQERIAFWKLSK